MASEPRVNIRSQDHRSAMPPGACPLPAGSADSSPLSAPARERVVDAVDRLSGLASAPPAPLIGSELSGSDGQAVAAAGLPKIVKFAALARCGDEIWIENEGQIYRLRKTRQGKLILTK